MNRIHRRLDDDFPIGEHVIKAPRALVRLNHGGPWSRAILALVDTGSPFTIVAPDVARTLGWEQPPGEPPLDLSGIGGEKRTAGWPTTMDLAFVQSQSQEPELGLYLPASAVILSTLMEGGSVLIGQHDALERLCFLQRNQDPFWDFELTLPTDA